MRKVRGKLEFRDSCGVLSCKFHKAMVQKKRRKTTLMNYGVEHISQLRYIKISKKIKMLSYNITNNYFNDLTKIEIRELIEKYNTKKEDKDLYYKLVDRHTRKNKPKDAKIGFKYKTELDHKFSKFMGFILNIPPYIIGSEYNLAVIGDIENSSKSIRCSIKLDDLYSSIYGE